MLRWVDPKQYDTGNRLAAAKHQIAEVLIFREQEPTLYLRLNQNLCVGRRRRSLGRRGNVVSRSTQVPHQTGVDTFIGQPTHG